VSQNVLQDFEFEYRQEQTLRLRRRVLWYCAITFVFGIVTLLLLVNNAEGFVEPTSHLRRPMTVLLVVSSLVSTVPYLWALWHFWRTRQEREGMLRILYRLLSLSLIAGIVTGFAVAAVRDGSGNATGVFAFNVLVSVLFSHLFACVLLPWTPRESLRPFYAALAVAGGTVAYLLLVVSKGELWLRGILLVGFVVACACALLPGLAISWWKNNRFAREFLVKNLGNRYGEMRRELSGAQRIHESLFPPPQTRHGISFGYAYAPMRSIGGDYLYARFLPSRSSRHEGRRSGQGDVGRNDHLASNGAPAGPSLATPAPGGGGGGDGAGVAVAPAIEAAQTIEVAAPTQDLLVLLLDVCGHGITAALTVNRLYGELERLVAEDPLITPTALLRALNRYAYLTLSDHSLFVTAIALRVEPPGAGEEASAPAVVQYANAGHPPACVVGGPAGTGSSPIAVMLEPTAMVLGVSRELEVEREDAHAPLPLGATLIAYTDGAMEARNAQGSMLNVAGVVEAAERAAGVPTERRCDAVMSAVASHRFGPLSDDTLVVAVSRV
jgi:serine phosphatase RsbU (regulator of sigma subunit)